MAQRKWGLSVAVCLAVAAFCLIYPLYVIQPFRPQGPRELMAALAVIRARGAVLAIVTLGAIASAVLYWRTEPRRWRRAAATLGAVLTVGFAVLARINVYEIMFHPVDRPSFASAAETRLDGDEKVITVAVAGAARAYPIRSMSYHHILNDELGGVPLVATY